MSAADPGSVQDERFMRAALTLGRRGWGTTAPNPCVAAIVVRHGVILARAVTASGGRPHAETQALMAAGEAARGATLYVTLEPCSHVGQTRPCTEAIIAAGIARVVIAVGDPDARVAGQGVAQLRQAGIAVTIGVCAETAKRHHLGHIRRVTEGRPALTLKLAETADGFAAGGAGGPRLMITGTEAGAWVHMARAMHDAVMVGIGTALADDPLMTVRLPGMEARQPARVVIDTQAALQPGSRVVANPGAGPLLVVTGSGAGQDRVDALRQAGAEVIPVALAPDHHIDLEAALLAMGTRGFTRIFCEGGPTLAGALLTRNLVDEVVLLTADTSLAGPGLRALDDDSRARLASASFRLVEDREIGHDRLRRFQKD